MKPSWKRFVVLSQLDEVSKRIRIDLALRARSLCPREGHRRGQKRDDVALVDAALS